MRAATALFAALLALLPPTASAAAAVAPPDTGIDGLMQAYDGQVPGAAALVLLDGRPVFRRGYGLAVVEDATAVTAASNFRLASISKQFTAAAVLLLVEDGRLALDQPAHRWLPELPPAAATITLRQLLSHTSGLLDYEDLMDPADTRQVHDADVLALLARQDRVDFAPGTRYRYSNSGYALLALIVERASGIDYASFLQQRIFAPLGMAHSVAHQDGVDAIAARAYGYSWIDGHWQRTDQSTTSAVLGDGGIYASLDDLARWDAALYDNRLLSAASRRAMFSPATATPEPDVPHYGFGWRLNGRAQWHSGESIGFRNVILRYPDKHLTVIVLSNRNAPEPYPLALKIAQRWLDTLQ
ncbi:TPA: beta-lactamase family protein [Stenotrophomonas maltophilia]|nr:beta-lactamase family protein [Stenotrophomonas maltophilia]HDS1043020.1 beta-lactamase family protein [Stenotrophomonas maltophilia]